MLTGGAATGDGAGDQAATVARFATQVDRSGAGTVLAGGAGSADGTGAIGVVRADTAATSILSTVDNVQYPGRPGGRPCWRSASSWRARPAGTATPATRNGRRLALRRNDDHAT